MRPSDLARLSALKARREETALRSLLRSAQRRTDAERDRQIAAREAAEGEASRLRDEAGIYAEVRAGIAMGSAALVAHRMRLSRLSAAVEAARAAEAEARQRSAEWAVACEADRRVHAEAARAASRARRIEGLVLAAREAEAEHAAEIEQEDDVVMRRPIGRGEP